MPNRILIVDDNDIQLDIISSMLEEMLRPENVICLNSARSVLNIAKSFNPDIILMDLVMPNKCGDEAHTELRSDPITQKIPIVFITASEDFKTTKFALSLNSDLDSVLVKPVDKTELLHEIRCLVNNERMITSIDTALSSISCLRTSYEKIN